jgi:hypothetical protein
MMVKVILLVLLSTRETGIDCLHIPERKCLSPLRRILCYSHVFTFCWQLREGVAVLQSELLIFFCGVQGWHSESWKIRVIEV